MGVTTKKIARPAWMIAATSADISTPIRRTRTRLVIAHDAENIPCADLVNFTVIDTKCIGGMAYSEESGEEGVPDSPDQIVHPRAVVLVDCINRGCQDNDQYSTQRCHPVADDHGAWHWSGSGRCP